MSATDISEAAKDALIDIADKEVDTIEPRFSSQLGFYYEEIFRSAAKHRVSERLILDELVKMGYLKRELYDKFTRCPNCQSYRLLVRLVCPRCGSINVRRATLFSHVPCGYIGTLEETLREGKYVCPRCGKTLKKEGRDWIKVGVLFKCDDCGETFDRTDVKFRCTNCQREFMHREADYHPIYRYRVNRRKVLEAIASIIEEAILSRLKKEGYTIRRGVTVRGSSGIQHSLGIIVERKGKQASIHVLVHEDPEETRGQILSLYGMSLDTPDIQHIVIIPREHSGYGPAGLNLHVVSSNSIRNTIESTIAKIKEVIG